MKVSTQIMESEDADEHHQSGDSELSQTDPPNKRHRLDVDENTPLDLSPTVWDQKVFIAASKPINIPLRPTPDAPTTGQPGTSNSLLRDLLERDWFQADSEHEATDSGSNTPPPLIIQPPAKSAKRVGYRDTSTHSNWPNIVYRLTYVLGLLSRPNVVVDSVHVPLVPPLANPWYAPMKDIYEKRKQGIAITAAEATYFDSCKGFMYLPVLKTFNSMIASRRYRSTVIENELVVCQAWMAAHPNYCVFCQVIHSPATGPHPHTCYFVNTNGPRGIQDLKLDKSWLSAAKAVFLSCQHLYYMPGALRAKIINVATNVECEYMMPARAQEIQNPPITHENSLIFRIHEIIHLIGATNRMPILIEFHENHKYPTADLVLHIVGFATAVRYCQPNYAGPLIVIIPPVKAVLGETTESYNTKKTRLAAAQNYGHLVGTAMGVPIIHIQAQVTQFTEAGEGIHYSSWIPEPLFNNAGAHTREYMSRLYVWFDTFIKVLYGEISLGGAATFLKP